MNIFNNPTILYSHGGKITNLPLPVSVFSCFIGIILLIRYEKCRLSASFLFSFFIVMLLTIFIASSNDYKNNLGKIILLIQYILPVFGLLLGQSYIESANKKLSFEAISLYMLLLIIPFEVIATIVQGTIILTPYLYFFSIYQHLQYVPMILIGLYFFSLLSLFNDHDMRKLLLFLAPFIVIYAAMSFSLLAILTIIIGMLFIVLKLMMKNMYKYIFIIFSVFAAISLILYINMTSLVHPIPLNDPDMIVKLKSIDEDGIPANVKSRLHIWGVYWEKITESPRLLMFGHEEIQDRNLYPSAHNYYLDLIYNFGFLSLLPIMFLIMYTIIKLYGNKRKVMLSPGFLGLAVLVLFFLLVDNSLKVGLRQPYPGFIMFFLWGVLLNRLTGVADKGNKE